MINEALLKRNFFLMLSVVDGQRLAHEAGFSLPSEDVQRSELLEVIHKWLIMSGSGMLQTIKTCADWAIEEDSEEAPEERAATIDALVGFSVALLAYLLDTDAIALSPTLTISEDSSASFFSDLFKSVIEDVDLDEQ